MRPAAGRAWGAGCVEAGHGGLGPPAAPAPRSGAIWLAVGMAALTAAALCVRLPRLGDRPMHGDEANQAVKAALLRETGVYRYDPQDNHGPTLYWLSLPWLWLSGHGLADSREADFRIVPVIFGAALVPALLLLRGSLGAVAVVAAGVLSALSPALVFYSRYYIQETLLVFFTFGAIACAWQAAGKRDWRWATGAGLCAGLMDATKETWVLSAAAAAAGAALTAVWSRLRDGTWPDLASLRQGRLWLAAAISGVAVAVAFYSSFGTHWSGVADSLRAYWNYWERGTAGSEHAHPWYFYIERLWWFRPARGLMWSEGVIGALAAIGLAESLVRRSGLPGPDVRLVRFLGFYTVVLAGLYAVIPYKTPWCMLGFAHGRAGPCGPQQHLPC